MTPLELKKLQLAKLRQEDQAKLRFAFDGNDPESRPTKAQQELLEDTKTSVHWVICGNRCLEEGTLVATPEGPRAIESLKVGDTVFDKRGAPTKVLNVFYQGIQEVGDLTSRGHKVWASSTANHVWLTTTQRNWTAEVRSDELGRYTQVVRCPIPASKLGNVHCATTYSLGAFLGDGCSRERRLTISSGNELVPQAIAKELGITVKRNHPKNYNWNFSEGALPEYYESWCKGRYAHEKTADLEIVKTWDRISLLRFLAGLTDTDGSFHVNKEAVTWALTMQAKPVLEAAEYAILALWGVQATWHTDKRTKYKNGPCYELIVRNPHDTRRMMEELTPHLIVEHKRWKPEYSLIGGKRSSLTKVKLTWGANRRRVRTWDIEVEAKDHLFLLANGLVTHNSGKSSTGARICAWWFLENHPYMTRPDAWKGALQILVIGRLGEQMDSELWSKKIKPLLPGGSFKETRIGGMLQRVTNTRNGNKLIFLSHHDALNAREKVQAFTANIVWLDEMPDHAGLVTELMMRTLTTGGRLYATFTPLLKNQEIYRLVTQSHPSAKYHKFLMLDNPIFKGREAEVLAEVRAMCSSEAEFRARVYGEWWEGDTRATRYRPEEHRRDLPSHYSATFWRHLAILDPAASGLAGLTVWAEDPKVGTWYCVKSKYLRGTAAYDLLDSVEAELVGLGNLTRWSDCNPAGFYKEAARRSVPWKAYTEKQDRKVLTLDKLNARLLEHKMVLTPQADLLGDELLRAEWAPGGDKIANATSFHLLDTARYASDVLPTFDLVTFKPQTQEQAVRQAWKQLKAKEAKAKAKIIERRPAWARQQPRRSTSYWGR